MYHDTHHAIITLYLTLFQQSPKVAVFAANLKCLCNLVHFVQNVYLVKADAFMYPANVNELGSNINVLASNQLSFDIKVQEGCCCSSLTTQKAPK